MTTPGPADQADRAAPAQPATVEVRRSPRRRRTVSAYRDGGRIVVLVPSHLSPAREREWVARMVRQVEAAEAGSRPTDEALAARAAELSAAYLGGRARPRSVRWVDNQRRRWGSCTPADGTIRLSTRLRPFPAWVLDYVLLHELAHLLEPSHSAAFWELLAGFERTERARGFLEGVDAATRAAPAPDDPGVGPSTAASDGPDPPESLGPGPGPE